MKVRRGDVVLVWYPFASGQGGSRRPAVIVQNDHDNDRLDNTVLAQITTTMHHADEATQVLILARSPAGRVAGLLHDSVVSCNNLATVHVDRIQHVIGHLTDALMARIDTCLQVALALR